MSTGRHADPVAWRVRRVEGGASKTTVNGDIASLRSVFSHAVRIQLLGENPLAGIRQFKTDTSAVVRYLSDEEDASPDIRVTDLLCAP